MVAVELIEDGAGLGQFRPEWSRFVLRRSPVNPFQRPEWLATWWSHFGSGSLRVMVFRREGEVAGVLPCFLHEWEGRRQITLVGSGITDYLDPLFQPELVPEILEHARARLENWRDWDLCNWQDLSWHTPLEALGTAAEETACSAITIEHSFEAFLAARPKDLKRNLRRYRDRAEAMGSLKFEVSHTAGAELMDSLIRLHGLRWAKAGEAGMIHANRSEAFLREAAELLGSCGALRIFTLTFNDSIAAIILALCNETAIFSYLSAFDPDQEKLGLGRELLAQALRYAHEHGYRYWNFLRGQEPYKFSWGAQLLPKRRVTILPHKRM